MIRRIAVAAAVALGLIVMPGGMAGEAPAVPAAEMVLPENVWTRVAEVPPDPLGRELEPGRGAFMAYVPKTGKFLRYGGYTPTDCNALWTFDLAGRRWENPLEVDYNWPPPTDRPGAGPWWSQAYDSKRGVVWFFGGWGLVGRTHRELMRDVWRYDPEEGTFEAMEARNTPGVPLDGLPIVYDSENDLLILAPQARGGRFDQNLRGQTYVYDPNTNAWERRETPEMPHRVRYGPQVFVFALCAGKAVYLENEPGGGPSATWTYDAAENEWSKLETEESPAGRVVAGSAYDPVNEVVIIYGGAGYGDVRGGGSAGYLSGGNGEPLHDTWALDLSEPEWKQLDVGAPVLTELPGETHTRFEIVTAMDYDTDRQTIVMAAPTMGVWALRYRPEGADPLPEVTLAELPEFVPPEAPERVYPMAPPNERLLNLPPNEWVELGGGRRIGGNEVPVKYDESTGFVISYAGCGSRGTTFSAGYANHLSAFDPATERWIALRWYDPCGPPRPGNGCNMFMAYDSRRERAWFHGGTTQNRLARSILPDWQGGSFIWSYHGKTDRFEMFPVRERPRMGNGVITTYDKENDLFVINEGSYWDSVYGFSPETGRWRKLGDHRSAGYSFACYVDSLKGMFMLARGTTPCLFNVEEGEWKELESKGDAPEVGGHQWQRRSSSAYDPEANAVLAVGNRQTSVYNVETGEWKQMGQSPHCQYFDNHVVYDSRHKVFLLLPGMARNTNVHAFRLELE